MAEKIKPLNRMAQILHRAAGNPASASPNAAISNCFPGLEYDFKNFWRRAFVGIVLLECDNYVVEIEDDQYQGLLHHRLLKVEDHPIVTTVQGPVSPGGDSSPLTSKANPDAVASMEWSNALAFVMQRQDQFVKCFFTLDEANTTEPIPGDKARMLEVELKVRPIFHAATAAPSEELLKPGELTQGLCSPWQHDYRECACYYWPATRPDYVNVEPTADGVTRGDNWMSKERSGEYFLDDRKDGLFLTYDDLFKAWEEGLQFQVKGRDARESS